MKKAIRGEISVADLSSRTAFTLYGVDGTAYNLGEREQVVINSIEWSTADVDPAMLMTVFFDADGDTAITAGERIATFDALNAVSGGTSVHGQRVFDGGRLCKPGINPSAIASEVNTGLGTFTLILHGYIKA